MLQIADLRFAYGDRPVLRGLSLEAREGEVVAVVGPNGSGKSTLLKVISGLLKPGCGEVRWGGRDLLSLPPRERARLVGVVPQAPHLPESFTALELVLMGRTPYLGFLQGERKLDLDVALRAMEMTGTQGLAHQPVGELSGGERQRVLIARALAQETPLLLLDEPTASLDIAYQVAILDTVRAIQGRRGGAILVAIHDLTLAAQYCHRIVLLKDGVCYAQGTPQEVLTRENVLEGYGAQVCILEHPISGMPVVLPVPGAAGADGDGAH
ncbi:MAG: iron complex transport system ATP-binding protein [Dehalococcoidia bacterium]|nr:iron complex transport system ATP-binding protein [Dehalococcoidia bacterium]